MAADSINIKQVEFSPQQQRVLRLLFKFRFLSTHLLSRIIGISRFGAYKTLEALVINKLVTKVYSNDYRIKGKPAYYYLNSAGVSAVRKLMVLKEYEVNALYKNSTMTNEFVDHCLAVVACYIAVRAQLAQESNIFSKTEIRRYQFFPRNQPDLYLRTPEDKQAMIIIAHDIPLYLVHKRLREIITHSEDGEWGDEEYPAVCFVLKNNSTKTRFLHQTYSTLNGMGIEVSELRILATTTESIESNQAIIWTNAFNLTKLQPMFT